MKNATPAAPANHAHVGMEERSNPPITVEEATAALPLLLPFAGLAAAPAAAAGADIVN